MEVTWVGVRWVRWCAKDGCKPERRSTHTLSLEAWPHVACLSLLHAEGSRLEGGQTTWGVFLMALKFWCGCEDSQVTNWGCERFCKHINLQQWLQ